LNQYKRGIFNRYRKGMPWPEMLTKDIMAGAAMFRQRISGNADKTILVYPHYPSRGSTIFRIAKKLGFEVTNKISRSKNLAIYWEYNTVRSEFQPLTELTATRVINLFNRDISKDKVDQAMHASFGYSTVLDPLTHQGVVVKKSLQNAVHDGQKIECPTSPEQGFIYQKFIDSSVNDKEVMDLRIPLMKGTIPHIYLNYRNNQERFKNVPDRAVLAENVEDLLSEEEIRKLADFCQIFQLEYGELDVLRDTNDGRIYIVDANNTPQGPPKHLPEKDKIRAVELLSRSFEKAFIHEA